MTRVRITGGWAISLATVALMLGCGESGPEKYEVSGAVTYQGQPINFGRMVFEPQEGVANVETMDAAVIRDGRYTMETVGGPQMVTVEDMTGHIDLDPEGAKAGKRPLLPGSYRGKVEFPPLAEVGADGGPVTVDIDIPRPPW